MSGNFGLHWSGRNKKRSVKERRRMKQTLITLAFLLAFGLACSNMPRENTTANTNVAATPAVTTSPKAANQTITKANVKASDVPTITSIEWKDYDNIYNVKSNSTDVQKEAAWKRFQDQYVEWQGAVAEVQNGTFSGLTVGVKINRDTLVQDVLVTLKPDQKDKAANLTKGQKIKFTGRLKNYGGALLPLSIDDGEIK